MLSIFYIHTRKFLIPDIAHKQITHVNFQNITEIFNLNAKIQNRNDKNESW